MDDVVISLDKPVSGRLLDHAPTESDACREARGYIGQGEAQRIHIRRRPETAYSLERFELYAV